MPLRVLDFSGALLEARPPTPTEFQRMLLFPDPIVVVGLPGTETSLHARWTSSICEGETTIQIDAAIRVIEVQQPPRKECDAAGTFVDLILTFDRPVDADLVVGYVVQGPISSP